MPLYEFECKSCGEINEMLMKVSDPAPNSCLSCQGGPLHKLMSRTNFILKGQGWYETDFKDKKPAKAQGSSASPSAKKEDNSSSASEPSPAPSSEPSSTAKNETPAVSKTP